jgi:hypothetical protein
MQLTRTLNSLVVAPEKAPTTLTLDDILVDFPYLPVQTAVLGQGEDGYPVLFDLNDPRPGPLLVTAENGCGKTNLLKVVASSLARNNSRYDVQVSILSPKPEEWGGYGGIFPTWERAAGDQVVELAAIAEQRRWGRELGAAQVLLLDGLEQVKRWDDDPQIYFDWMLREGPAMGVWTIATVSPEESLSLGRLMTGFRTRLLGRVDAHSTARRLAQSDEGPQRAMTGVGKFSVQIGGSWLAFQAPLA